MNLSADCRRTLSIHSPIISDPYSSAKSESKMFLPVHLRWVLDKDSGVEHVTFEAFVKHFNMSDRKQATDTYKALIWSDEIRSSRRKNLQDAFSEFEAHHADIFWSQRQLEISSEITSNESAVDLQRAAVGKSRKGYSESMGQVGKPTQKKNSGALLSSSPSEAAPALPVASTVDDDTVTAVDTDNGDGSEKVVEVEDDSPLELSRSKAYEDALRLFKGSPLLPFFKYIFRKAQGSTDEVPQLPTDIPSTNLKRLIAYAHRVLTGNDALHDLKDVYVALSCIVSATVKDASFIFGTGLITRIVSQVTLKELALPILAKVLSPLQESFAENDYDLNFLQGEVELRLAELVLCERDGKWVTKEAKVDGMVSRQVYQILHFFCVVIGSGQFENKNSETECVAYWSHVWRILFTKTCIVVNTGEIASVATKEDMHINELLFGTVTQSGGRKTDTLVLAKEVSGGEVHYIECSVNEHKPLHAGQATLKEQSRKLVRINRSILSCTGSKKTVVFIDVHGLCGKIYGMRAVEDVYGVSAALGKICLPSNGFEMYEFLSGSSLQTLFRYKTHMVEFGQDVLQKRAHNRVHTPPNSPSLRPTTPSLFTPTKKRAGVFTPSAPVSPSLRSASRRRLA